MEKPNSFDRLIFLRRRVERLIGERDQIQRTLQEIRSRISELETKSIRVEEALEIAKHVGLATQQQLEYHLSDQVSLAMNAVFDDPYQLKVQFVERRGKTEVELLFTRNGLEFPPLGFAGGGTIDVAALALRIAYWSMRRDAKVRPVLILDEPLSQLKGEDANRRALSILQEISHKLGLQVIMVSDERVPREDIIAYADKVFEVSKNSRGESCIISYGRDNGREERMGARACGCG